MTSAARLTHADIAERLGMPLSTVIYLRKREGWPHVRVGKAVRFTEQMLEEIITSHIVTEEPDEKPVFEGQRPHRPRST